MKSDRLNNKYDFRMARGPLPDRSGPAAQHSADWYAEARRNKAIAIGFIFVVSSLALALGALLWQ